MSRADDPWGESSLEWHGDMPDESGLPEEYVSTGRTCDRCGEARPLSYYPEYGAMFCDSCGVDPQSSSG